MLSLRIVKVTHTIVWAVFAGCIVGIPIVALRGDLDRALLLIGIVSIECLVLAVNRMRCPLTAVAARFTADRCDNFDIYLPLWLARYNKVIFGSLFAAGVLVTVLQWRRSA
ncbi:MAG: hypothetical protein ACREBE_25665 [bacterium]